MNKENLLLIKRRVTQKKLDSTNTEVPPPISHPSEESKLSELQTGVSHETQPIAQRIEAHKSNLALIHGKNPRRQSFGSSTIVPSSDTDKQLKAFKAQFTNHSSASLGSRILASKAEPKALSSTIEETSVFTTLRPRILWRCKCCQQHCIPVRRESRCLCGHRLKEHASPSTIDKPFRCEAKSCACQHFKFIVAEGAWILKCRCKHKHIEHDCARHPFLCKKCPGSSCSGFDSPWVCNCGHGFASHEQLTVMRSEQEMGALLQDVYNDADDVNAPPGSSGGGGSGGGVLKPRTFAVRQDGLLAKELREDAARR